MNCGSHFQHIRAQLNQRGALVNPRGTGTKEWNRVSGHCGSGSRVKLSTAISFSLFTPARLSRWPLPLCYPLVTADAPKP
ncbi:hypothetical protein SKAU_G00269230 [Synaphobranchus kaupii]|uniref:Uncharacterized protein n=1 Tax=Synaphobranchus kaupii TaxID=118154 RepID=A0A9Q1F095_SYNKA|nr:hypothetical protein SKAU_G00269230 [Synaphobranchus kaupii]